MLATTGQRRRATGETASGRQPSASAVLRLLRGEDLELISRELGVRVAEFSAWLPKGALRIRLDLFEDAGRVQ